ncbi:Bifunctional protein FolD [Nymphon striatum]|nr:Bifunctional protein FolD [Nymphon striatum]
MLGSTNDNCTLSCEAWIWMYFERPLAENTNANKTKMQRSLSHKLCVNDTLFHLQTIVLQNFVINGLKKRSFWNGALPFTNDFKGEVAAEVVETVKAATAKLTAGTGVVPVYVRSKGKRATECGFHSVTHTMPEETSEADLLAIDGILVQLPLPKHIDEGKVIQMIAPEKDVDGFHFINVGKLGTGETDTAFVPCTPAGSMVLLKKALGTADLSGLNAVVVGRSNIVGKPMMNLLLSANATVTVAHSRTKDLPALCKTADILVAAVGRPEMIKSDWVKPGASVIDVGINRIDAPEKGEGKSRLVGDVAYDESAAVAGSITPVPGGVGPMTIAMLMANTLESACRRAGNFGMDPRFIDGKAVASRIYEAVRAEFDALGGVKRKLVSISIGGDPEVAVYIRNQVRGAERAGIPFDDQYWDGDLTQEECKARITAMNDDPAIVGKPAAFMLMAEGATVTVCHHMTRSVAAHSRRADAVLVAVGIPNFLKADMVKPGAAVIDIGINQTVDADGNVKIVGDVDTDNVLEVASWVTPVPGGVGL